MGTFNVTSSNLNNQYTYSNATVIVVGNYNMDATTNTLKNISGSVRRQSMEEEEGYITDFISYMRDGVLKTSFTEEMTKEDYATVLDAIDEIDDFVRGIDANVEE